MERWSASPPDVLNTYKPPLSDDTPNFYVENKQEKRVNVTQESLTAARGGGRGSKKGERGLRPAVRAVARRSSATARRRSECRTRFGDAPALQELRSPSSTSSASCQTQPTSVLMSVVAEDLLASP